MKDCEVVESEPVEVNPGELEGFEAEEEKGDGGGGARVEFIELSGGRSEGKEEEV